MLVFAYGRSPVHRSTVLLALFAMLSVLLALAAINGLLDPIVEILGR